MGKSSGIVAVVLFFVVACGGSNSTLPPEVQEHVKSTKTALTSGDPDATCSGLNALTESLYEWQSFARGNQPVMIQEMLHGLDFVGSDCAGRVDAETEIDMDRIAERFDAWRSKTNKKTKRKSGFLTWVLYILGPLVVAGFVMFWRRKFREA